MAVVTPLLMVIVRTLEESSVIRVRSGSGARNAAVVHEHHGYPVEFPFLVVNVGGVGLDYEIVVAAGGRDDCLFGPLGELPQFHTGIQGLCHDVKTVAEHLHFTDVGAPGTFPDVLDQRGSGGGTVAAPQLVSVGTVVGAENRVVAVENDQVARI